MKRIFARWFISFLFLLLFLTLIHGYINTGDSHDIGREVLFYMICLSLIFGLLLSLVWQVFYEKRAYENYIISEIKKINGLYKHEVLNAQKSVFELLSRNKILFADPRDALLVGAVNEQIASFLLRDDCTYKFLSSSVLRLMSDLQFSGYNKLFDIFHNITEAMYYPIKYECFPRFKLTGKMPALSGIYWPEDNLLTLKVKFFFEQSNEIRARLDYLREELKEEIERLGAPDYKESGSPSSDKR